MPSRVCLPQGPSAKPIALLPHKEGKAGSDLQGEEEGRGASLPSSLVITEGQIDTAVLAAVNSSLTSNFPLSSVVEETKTCSKSVS